jgi:hypothetical protein
VPPLPLSDLAAGGRFLLAVGRLLGRPLSPETCRARLAQRLARRERDFARLIQQAVYARPASPYLTLLRLAGCEAGDFERLVQQEGLEGALTALLRAGVYLSVDECKGRRPVVRGSARFELEPGALRNPWLPGEVPVQTSGSRGRSLAASVSLEFVLDHAVDSLLVYQAYGGLAWQHAYWGVPGGDPLLNLLEFSCWGRPPARWFSSVDPATPALAPRYRWSARALGWAGRLHRFPLPQPEHVPLERPRPIVDWLRAAVRRGQQPHLWGYASSAVRVCQAALAAGLDLAGAWFTAGGEPLTEARRALIERTGAGLVPRYGSTECDVIAYGCQHPTAADDLHLLHDRLAVIQPGLEADQVGARSRAAPARLGLPLAAPRAGPSQAPNAAGEPAGLPPESLFFTSLRPANPLLLLNVSLGDQAVLESRRCGCPLEQLGWTTHLHQVRSFEKLTAEGMAFLDAQVVQILEETLPARFGGGPTHYQLVEDERPDGRPWLRLLVHPAVGPLDEDALTETFFDALATGNGPERVMALQWRTANLLTVERRPPETTRSGKIQHLHRGPTPTPSS